MKKSPNTSPTDEQEKLLKHVNPDATYTSGGSTIPTQGSLNNHPSAVTPPNSRSKSHSLYKGRHHSSGGKSHSFYTKFNFPTLGSNHISGPKKIDNQAGQHNNHHPSTQVNDLSAAESDLDILARRRVDAVYDEHFIKIFCSVLEEFCEDKKDEKKAKLPLSRYQLIVLYIFRTNVKIDQSVVAKYSDILPMNQLATVNIPEQIKHACDLILKIHRKAFYQLLEKFSQAVNKNTPWLFKLAITPTDISNNNAFQSFRASQTKELEGQNTRCKDIKHEECLQQLQQLYQTQGPKNPFAISPVAFKIQPVSSEATIKVNIPQNNSNLVSQDGSINGAHEKESRSALGFH